MVWFSYHGGHSGEFCKHAKGPLRQVVERACELGFSTYGLTEHCPRLRQQDLYPEEAPLTPDDLQAMFAAYVTEARALQKEFEDRIELLVGFETEALPEDSWPTAMRAIQAQHDFDFFVGSVHSVGGTYIDYKPEMTQQLAAQHGGWDELCAAYFDQVSEVVATLQPPIVGHLDLIRRFRGNDVEISPAVWPSLRRTLEVIKTSGALLELNAAPARRDFGPVYPAPSILATARELGIPITLSDDSHGAHAVGGGLDACLAAAKTAGYESVHYLTRASQGAGERTRFNPDIVVRSAPLDEVRPRRPKARA